MVDDFSDWLSDALHNIVLVLPKLVGFIVILLIGFLIAKIVYVVVEKSLDRLRFGGLVSKLGPSGPSPVPSNWSPAEVVAKIAWLLVVLVTALLAFNVWGANNPVSSLLRSAIAFIPNLFVAVVIIGIGLWVARTIRDILVGAIGRMEYSNIISAFVYWLIVVLAVFAALAQIGVALVLTTTLLLFVFGTIAGILIVGVGGGLIRPMQDRWDSLLDRGSEHVDAVVDAIDDEPALSDDGTPEAPMQSPRAARTRKGYRPPK